MADRRYQPRTKDGAPPFTARQLQQGEPAPNGMNARAGDYIIESGPHAGVWPADRFEETFLDVDGEGSSESDARAGAGADVARSSGLTDADLIGLARSFVELTDRVDLVEKRHDDDLDAYGRRLGALEQRVASIGVVVPTSSAGASPAVSSSSSEGTATGASTSTIGNPTSNTNIGNPT